MVSEDGREAPELLVLVLFPTLHSFDLLFFPIAVAH